MTTGNVHLVKSAQRVLEVLEYFDVDHPTATVTDISEALSYPQSSSSVLLRCLRQLGYLYYNRENRTYRPTVRAALLGIWAEDSAYRGGKMIQLVDAVAERLGETVMLSTNNVDYAVYHVHVRRGASANAVDIRSNESEQLLHTAPGELILSSYPEHLIKLALHRINSDEEDPSRRVNINAKIADMQKMKANKWAVAYSPGPPEIGTAAVLLPRRRGGDRVTLSVVAQGSVMQAKSDEFIRAILEERDRIFSA